MAMARRRDARRLCTGGSARLRSRYLEGGTCALARAGHLLPPGTPVCTNTCARTRGGGTGAYRYADIRTRTRTPIRFLLVRSTGRNTTAPRRAAPRRAAPHRAGPRPGPSSKSPPLTSTEHARSDFSPRSARVVQYETRRRQAGRRAAVARGRNDTARHACTHARTHVPINPRA
jgi:hypothetical protein